MAVRIFPVRSGTFSFEIEPIVGSNAHISGPLFLFLVLRILVVVLAETNLMGFDSKNPKRFEKSILRSSEGAAAQESVLYGKSIEPNLSANCGNLRTSSQNSKTLSAKV